MIHAWKELSELASTDMEQARGRLQDFKDEVERISQEVSYDG